MKKIENHFKKIAYGCGVIAAVVSFSQAAVAGWTVDGNKILDPNGENFIYRGINLGNAPVQGSLHFVFRDIAATGANAIRIPVSIGTSASDLRYYINLCKENKLVCLLTGAGSTGYGDGVDASAMVNLALYWGSPDIKSVLQEYEDFAIINLANAPAGNLLPASNYIGLTKQSIEMLRYTGIKNQIMVDGSNWGQDWSFAMRDSAEELFAADSLKNLVFSVHMYEAYSDPALIRDYLTRFTSRNLPIVVGEFAFKRKQRSGEVQNPYGNNTDVAEDAIMQITRELGVGYLGWAWSGNTTAFADLNFVTNWDPFQITPWGNYIVNSENGIKATSKLATHYSTSSNQHSSTSSSVTANRQPYAILRDSVVQERCGFVYGRATAVESTDPDGDALSYEWEIYNSFSGNYEYKTGPEITFSMRPVTNYTVSVHVSDGRGGRSTASKTLRHSYSDNCIGSSSSSVRSSSSSSTVVVSSSTPSSIYPRSSSSSSSSASSGSTVCSSVITSSIRSSLSSTSSSVAAAKASCSYVVNNQWSNGFTASIRIKNTSNAVINGWDVNWQYSDGSKITNLWNANFSGVNPYNAKNLNWNSTIQPGQTIEFGFQGSKPAGAASVPVLTGSICQ